ncbi:ABC transporter permease [Saccharopolyspora sp. CA-218241]|uniref:ABC transporter permease n=1 Tax=Saccharopolyspora sp. CA-218241 TaxID=3240027 RepID=UPI003D998E9F
MRAAILLCLLAVPVAVGLLGDPLATDMRAVLLPPSPEHPLGTDALGRDVLARVAAGAVTSLGAAGLALVVSALIGLAVGAATGWSGGRGAAVVRALVDVAAALPPLIVALVAGLVAGPGWTTLLLALIAVGWLPFARQADALTASLRTRQWVLAHRAMGAGTLRIWWRSLLPELLPPVGALAVVRLPALINTVAALGFLGLGPPPPAPEWGAMLAASVDHLGVAPWLLAAPLAALVVAQFLIAALPFGRRTDRGG